MKPVALTLLVNSLSVLLRTVAAGAAVAACVLALLPAAAAADEQGLRARAAYVPNDSGSARAAADAGWTNTQWELNGPFGINAPDAWSQASRLGGSGGRGVIIAVLDSGIAYTDRGPYKRSPDLASARFVRGYDFVDDDPYPNDQYGHGTFVASTIAATANNAYGTVGVAYRARIMPLRVLDYEGRGYPSTISRAIRFATRQGADIINLSLELYDGPVLAPTPRSVTASKSVRSALADARKAGVVVISAAGNSSDPNVPAKRYDTLAINVGGTTEHGCLGDYSNHGPGLDVVAPGGGADADVPNDPNCKPAEPAGRDISGVSFRAQSPVAVRDPPALPRHLDRRPPGRRRRGARARLGRARHRPDARRGRASPRAHRARPRPARPRSLLRLGARRRGRRDRAAAGPQTVRMMSTEQGAWCDTLFGTEPSRKRLAPVMPLLPRTMRSLPRSSATSRIASAGSPCRANTSTATPAARISAAAASSVACTSSRGLIIHCRSCGTRWMDSSRSRASDTGS